MHLGTTGEEGWPHVTPVALGMDEALLLSVTGGRKKANLRRDPRACISAARNGSLAHVVVWGRVDLHTDDAAQDRWEQWMRVLYGAAFEQMRTPLSEGGTSLGVVTPERWRIYQVG